MSETVVLSQAGGREDSPSPQSGRADSVAPRTRAINDKRRKRY